MAPTTLQDVADRAKVSIRTVSNVVSGYEHVSDNMRLRVQKAIQELNYRPNIVARTLRTGRAGVLALVVPEIDVPYFGELARNVINAAADCGYRVIIDQTGHDHQREGQWLVGGNQLMLFDGVLFSPLVNAAQAAEMESKSHAPIIILGEYKFTGKFDHVAIDNVRAAFDATQHLIDIGRKNIAAIGKQPLEPYETPQLRTKGYLTALKKAGISPNPLYIRPAIHYHREDGYSATKELLDLKDRPDAIFCYSDLLAMGALRAIFEAGLRVPEDIAVIGIDDIEEGQYSRPALSTISLDTRFIASRAIERLVARINNPDLGAEEVVAPHVLKIRESTVR